MTRSLFKFHGQEFRLFLVMFFGTCGVLAILPFALWRFSLGQWLAGTLDLALVVALVGLVWVAKRHQRVDEAARIMVVLTTIACLVLAQVNGELLAYWCYPVLVSNLLLAGRSFGLAANFFLIVGLVLTPGLHTGATGRATFAITALLLSLYAYLYAVMTDSQRDKLASLATFDELTGAGNRRMMQIDLAEKFAHAARHKLNYAIAVVDLDHFKQVNDTYGHEAGDQVLKQFVTLAQEVVRADDRIYRMGGEEFVLFLPRTGHVGLVAFLDRLQANLGPRLAGPGGPVTVSIGAAVMHESDADWNAWLARADEALFRAKKEGRDRFCIAPARAATIGCGIVARDAA
jgi:diguanylate cyclase